MGTAGDGRPQEGIWETSDDSPVAATVALAGDRPYKVEGLDTWAMTCASLGSAKGGAFSFTAPRADFLVHLSADTPDSHKSQPKEAAAPVSRPSKS